MSQSPEPGATTRPGTTRPGVTRPGVTTEPGLTTYEAPPILEIVDTVHSRDTADASDPAPGADQATEASLAQRTSQSGGAKLAGRASLASRATRGMRAHALFTALFLVGASIRGLTLYAYRPAFEFDGDSFAYLKLSREFTPDPMRPAGYPLFLKSMAWTQDLWFVPLVQHLAGLGVGLTVYVLLVHRRVPRPVAALAAAPVLLDSYEITIEHFVMAEALFAAFVAAALVALLWSPRPSVWACGFAGASLAAAGLVRTVGVALAALVLAYVVIRRVGPLRVATFAVALAVPLVGYATWYHSYHGRYALTGGDAVWRYGRVAPIADCSRLDLSPEQMGLCSPHPAAERPSANYYVWDPLSPRFSLPVPEEQRDALLADFARQVVTKQPGDYARMVGGEMAHYFAPGRATSGHDWPIGTWQFPTGDEPAYLHNNREPLHTFPGDVATEIYVEPYTGYLRGYQRFGYLPGPVHAAAALLGLAAAVFAGRKPPRRRPEEFVDPGRPHAPDEVLEVLEVLEVVEDVEDGKDGRKGRFRWRRSRRTWTPITLERHRLRADCLMLVSAGMALLIVPATSVCFDYRYMIGTLLFFPPAAALAWRQFALARIGRGASVRRTPRRWFQ